MIGNPRLFPDRSGVILLVIVIFLTIVSWLGYYLITRSKFLSAAYGAEEVYDLASSL